MGNFKAKLGNIFKEFPGKIKINRKSFALLIILFVLGDFFYWWRYYKTPLEKWDDKILDANEYYEIKEINGQKIIGNKKAGLDFRILKDWRVEFPEYGDYLSLFSPGTIGAANQKGGIKQGCEIIITIYPIKTDLKTIEQELKDMHKYWDYPETYEIITVDKYPAIKNSAGIPKLGLYGIGVHVPVTKLFNQSKVYCLSVDFNFQDIDHCKQEFEKFLETVSIK